MARKATRAELDPTNQAGTRQRATRDNNRRLNNSAREVLAIWRNVDAKKTTRKKIINQETDDTLDFFVYDLSAQDKQDLSVEISDSVNENLETFAPIPPFDWYYEQYVEQAYRGGTIQENAEIGVLLAPIFGSITIETQSIISSSRYIDLVDAAVNKNYPLFKGLSETTSKQIFQVINDGIDGGLSKNAIRRKILERYEVAKSSAKRIVDTEVNRAYNNARTDLINLYRSLGEPLAVQHISALSSTTRAHHAARHGRAYTPEQQNKWWAEGVNRINCLCSVRAILVNRDGTVADKEAQNKVIARGKQIFESNQ